MSRLAKKPIELPKAVEIKFENHKVMAKGPKGTLTLDLPVGVEVKVEGNIVNVSIDERKHKKSFLGLYYALVKNTIIGVAQGFEKKLTLIGVGFRAALKGDSVDLQLGYSHPVSIKVPQGIKVSIDKSTAILIEGSNKQVVGQFAADIRAVRPPEPYKGKGVRYETEFVRKKAGKTAKGK